MSVKPDLITCSIKLSGLDQDYENAVERSAEESEQVRKSIASAGLRAEDLKTTSFDINAEYSYSRERTNGQEHKIFEGYHFRHVMYIEFPNDNRLFGRVLYALSHCPVEIDFSIGYTVSDIDSVKNSLLEKATADSRRKAGILAAAAGVRLGQVRQIDYSWDEMKISSTVGNGRNFAKSVSAAGEYEVDFNFNDIDVEDTVTIVWEIE